MVELTLSVPDDSLFAPYFNEDKTQTLRHVAYRGNIQVELTSPSRTNSIVLPYRPADTRLDTYSNFRFSSVHFWGENPNGIWNLTVRNRNDYENATVQVTIHGITFYGTDNTPEAVSRVPTQCHESCDPNKGCAASGAQYCDACANLRNAMTRECIDSCPQNFMERNGYCYKDNIPEEECVPDAPSSTQPSTTAAPSSTQASTTAAPSSTLTSTTAGAAVLLSSFTMLTIFMGLLSLWLASM